MGQRGSVGVARVPDSPLLTPHNFFTQPGETVPRRGPTHTTVLAPHLHSKPPFQRGFISWSTVSPSVWCLRLLWAKERRSVEVISSPKGVKRPHFFFHAQRSRRAVRGEAFVPQACALQHCNHVFLDSTLTALRRHTFLSWPGSGAGLFSSVRSAAQNKLLRLRPHTEYSLNVGKR